jgi:anti-anti-sigma factor
LNATVSASGLPGGGKTLLARIDPMMESDVEQEIMENFEIRDNVLVANVDLYWETHAAFREKVEELTNSDYEEIILDLSNVSFVFSAYMGTIGRLLAEAARKNKRLTVRISENLGWLFELVGFEKMINIEVVS